jgi:hypothetical protein
MNFRTIFLEFFRIKFYNMYLSCNLCI